ncbi:unnamed protein product [Cyprideis torosa]|uniref:Uncharacterized protein n=1 Tax=Cyprideis torosa TaxID=163714 RepID=A0A7R8WP73_9CRUS|nr:unnamed protein product [Cyprideis torosa]CAG0907012.1 unnamed protein product [Cyprideis torosa]
MAQICSFQEPGTYADLRDGCQTFYVCRYDAQPLRGTCVPGRIFVEDYHRCLSASEFPCQTSKVLSKGEIIHEPCDNGTEGFVPTQGCHGYMICKTGLPTERHWCVPGYLFDSDKKLCQPAADVECSESGRPTPKPTPTTSTTESPSNFKCNTAVKGSQCKKYYRCKDDDVEVEKAFTALPHLVGVVECPGGQVFHPRISRCVPGMSLVCLMDKSSRSSAESKAEVSQSHSTTPPPLLTTPPHPVFKPPPNYPRFTWADLHPFFQVHSSPPRRDQLDLNYQLNRKPFAYPPNPTSSLGNPALQLVSFNRRYFHRLPDPGSNQV